jgi:Flp pilus assembly protein TadD
VIQHHGFHEPTRQGQKVARNLRLLQIEAEEHPNDPFVLFNLGSLYLSQGDGAAALPLLGRSLQLSHPDDTIVPELHALLARSHHVAGQAAQALTACRAGRDRFPEDPELLFWEGMLLREQGDLGGAEACLLQVLQTPAGVGFTGADAGMQGY